jgi:uncharacterized protein DUF4382
MSTQIRRHHTGLVPLVCALLGAGGFALSATLSSCGGGGGSMMSMTPPMSNANGTAMVTVTDMPGDFLSYMVSVVSLKLTRADGTVVETVPVATRIDFAQLVDLSEVLSAQQVPAGMYTGVALTLDYSGAVIVVDNGAGGLTVPAANIINASTSAALVAPNSQMTLTLQLPSGTPLVISQGTVANLALDFNLSASNTVAPASITASTAPSALMVSVSPTLSASLAPDTSKQIRVRGTLVSVTDTSGNTSYTVMVRPFYSAAGDTGQVVVDTTSTTSFTLNGSAYTGNAGLSALGALGAGTLTLATGGFDLSTHTFTAAAVFAGSSVPGAGLDSVEGTVTARSANTLTVTHGWLDDHDMDDERFSRQVTVTVAAGTGVTEDGQSGTFGPQDISVGQHLLVFGKFGPDAMGNATLDASAGSARLMLTPLWGQFASSTGAIVTLNLQSLDGRAPSEFNFAGTGSSSANDASASAYSVSVPASLTLSMFAPMAPARFFGFVRPFGSAPPDFAAVTAVNYAATDALLTLAWPRPGVTAPFASPLSASNVMITQMTLQSAVFDVLAIGPERLNPASASGGLTFVPNSSAPMMIFAIGHGMSHKFELFSSFGDFVTALTTDLNGTTALLGVAADGPYDQTSGVMSVNRMGVELND